jgi:3,4-dihydroxy-2-butanone 4-phosphate synthase
VALRASAAARLGLKVLTVRQAVERGVVLRAVHAPGNISLLEARPARRIRRQLDEVSLLITVAAGLSAIGVHCVACGTFSRRRTRSGGSDPPVLWAPGGGIRGG